MKFLTAFIRPLLATLAILLGTLAAGCAATPQGGTALAPATTLAAAAVKAEEPAHEPTRLKATPAARNMTQRPPARRHKTKRPIAKRRVAVNKKPSPRGKRTRARTPRARPKAKRAPRAKRVKRPLVAVASAPTPAPAAPITSSVEPVLAPQAPTTSVASSAPILSVTLAGNVAKPTSPATHTPTRASRFPFDAPPGPTLGALGALLLLGALAVRVFRREPIQDLGHPTGTPTKLQWIEARADGPEHFLLEFTTVEGKRLVACDGELFLEVCMRNQDHTTVGHLEQRITPESFGVDEFDRPRFKARIPIEVPVFSGYEWLEAEFFVTPDGAETPLVETVAFLHPGGRDPEEEL